MIYNIDNNIYDIIYIIYILCCVYIYMRVYVCIHVKTNTNIIYIYIYREREREIIRVTIYTLYNTCYII